MAVTHADLEPNTGNTCLMSSKTGVFLVLLTILLGLSSFTLCLIAEATRSQVTWMNTRKTECVYRSSGKTPLVCAACAFVVLAIAMVMEHTYLLITVSKSSPTLLHLDPESPSANSLASHAGFFFIATWICFAIGEILLLAGVSVESGHLKNWSKPRHTCHVIRRGLFSCAAVFALTTVSLASALYLIAVRAQRLSRQLEQHSRTQVLHTSEAIVVFHDHANASPSPPQPTKDTTIFSVYKL
ncbi:uncharacterized protein LOC130962448 [Arachis stenosperma]|uniref:uncharacterized protein LOC130962448 n=1 Tax=Arachis stenosperma TaxID=217475 RepID=UPI0025ABEE3B|nr:uncharacterized protein LOC130962448 [Arachis stenosperma]